jgi:glycosyltransferase involved in cell wall biosynthesis
MGRGGADRLRGTAHSASTAVLARVTSWRMRRRLASWAAGWPAASVPPLRDENLRTTVVVPCYNHAAFLPFAVRSLLDQSLPRFDTILVDDCSQDGTGGLLEDLAEQLRARGTVTVARHDRNQGQAATLNEAIRLASTPLVTVLNDDDWLSADTLVAVLDVLRDDAAIALVGTGSRWFEGQGAPPESVPPPDAARVTVYRPEDVRTMRRPEDLNMTHSGMTLHRSAWELVGGYRSRVGDRLVPFSDRDLQLRVAALYPVAVIDAPLVWWRSDSSVDGGVNS